MAKNLIKTIKFLILIQTALVGLMVTSALGGCTDKGASSQPEDMKPDGNVSSDPSSPSSGSDDPLKELENEDKLPKIGSGGKMPVLEGLSVYPPNVDPDQDNVPNSAIPGHPEIAVDNCPNAFNPGQEDANHNGVGDSCE